MADLAMMKLLNILHGRSISRIEMFAVSWNNEGGFISICHGIDQ